MSTNYCSHCKHLYSLACASCSNYQGIPANFEERAERIRFMLDGSDTCFVAEAPADMTLEQLLKQADRIHPNWGACGIRSLYKEGEEDETPDVKFEYDDVIKIEPYQSFTIDQKGDN